MGPEETTLARWLIKKGAGDKKMAIIVNEFVDFGIDGQILEGQAARVAAVRFMDREIRELTTLHLALVEATEADAINRYVDCDREFYSVLSRAA